MPLTQLQLLQILPNARPVAGIFLPALNRSMFRYKINSRVRQAAFIAQIGHESGHLRRLVENLNYSAEGLAATWKERYRSIDGKPNDRANSLARRPEAIANDAYAGRNGNTAAGDGWRYRGRGLLQITGRSNYSVAGADLGLPLEDHPEMLEQPEYAAMSAAWWWSQRGLNEFADAARFQDIGSVINTGKPGRLPHGAAKRLALYQVALKALA
ncbi:glycoside hydrolase family 19 protein [Pseudomonas putida]|uniref:glycoside hydrolase family 19 protein n=1 Tax=Pseudomonas putida TaxID=303 RepID=UPI002363E258|nr:glycoside hydrolase family 19 protein [Pseudomonas putida]MDD2098936.1 glycoside hydrolase family 19 protein [Pseudomonas putida]